jgi:nitrate reductase NapAB chaperone NapD
MPIAGLVVTLSCAGAARTALVEQIKEVPGVTLGPHKEARLAMVLETGTLHEQRATWEALSALPGVAGIQLAYAHIDDSNRRDEDPKATHRPMQEVPS